MKHFYSDEEVKIHGLDADFLEVTGRLQTGMCDWVKCYRLLHQDIPGQEHITHPVLGKLGGTWIRMAVWCVRAGESFTLFSTKAIPGTSFSPGSAQGPASQVP